MINVHDVVQSSRRKQWKLSDRSYPYNLYADVFELSDGEQITLPDDIDETLDCVLSKLSKRQRELIQHIYVHHCSRNSFAALHNISSERVRQIHHIAWRKLRQVRLQLQLGNCEYAKYQEQQRIEADRLAKEEMRNMTCPIRKLNLSPRLHNAICRSQYCPHTLLDLCEISPREYMSIDEFGRKSAHKLMEKFKEVGVDYMALHAEEFNNKAVKSFFEATPADKLFAALKRCEKNRNKPDLHSFMIVLSNGVASVDVYGYNQVCIVYPGLADSANKWKGNIHQAVDKLVLLGALPDTIDM